MMEAEMVAYRGRRLLGVASVIALLAVAIVLPSAAGAGRLGPGGTFVVDDGNTHEGMIEAIVAEGITLGCNADPPWYCPSDDVRRDQMASFLARALGLPASTTNWFDDDDGNTHEASINSIADAGITLGFPDGTYQPAGLVSRAQMASFLKRALDLDPIIPPPPTTTTTTTTGGGTTQTITLAGVSCSPVDVTVSNGAMVTFDNVLGIHDLVWLSGPYSGESPASAGWSVTFTAGTAGTFAYYCNVHGNAGGDGMAGSLTVNP